MKTSEACDNRIYLLTSKVIYVLLSNLCFLLTISPIIFYFFVSGENLSISILTFFGILIGPALSTMFSVTKKLMMDDQDRAIKDYFHFYKLNFWQSLFIAAILNVMLMIFYIDVQYFFSIHQPIMAYACLIAAIIITAISFYVYPILARINAKTIDLLKLSMTYTFKKFYLTLTTLALIIIGVAIVNFTGIALIATLFGTSAICYMILKLEGPLLEEMELFLKEKYSN